MPVEVEAFPAPGGWTVDLATLYRRRYDPMVRLAYLLTGDLAVAEELVQDAFVAIHRSWRRVAEPDAYLRTAVVNGVRSWGRRRRLERLRLPAARQPVGLGADEMWDQLRRLPHRQRCAVVLRFYDDLPDTAIAAVLRCSPEAARSTLHRGLVALRKEYDR